MAKDKDIDATFCIENEDLGNWVVSLMEEMPLRRLIWRWQKAMKSIIK